MSEVKLFFDLFCRGEARVLAFSLDVGAPPPHLLSPVSVTSAHQENNNVPSPSDLFLSYFPALVPAPPPQLSLNPSSIFV